MSLMVRESKVGAIGMADNAAMGTMLLNGSASHTRYKRTRIGTGTMVVDALYFNWVEHAPHWYMQSKETTVAEVRYMLLTGLLLPISKTNKLPTACNRREAVQKKAAKVTLLDH